MDGVDSNLASSNPNVIHGIIILFLLLVSKGQDGPPEVNSVRREIGELAVWTLSSAKPGNGVDQLRDNSVSTFWQSDGVQPHYINI